MVLVPGYQRSHTRQGSHRCYREIGVVQMLLGQKTVEAALHKLQVHLNQCYFAAPSPLYKLFPNSSKAAGRREAAEAKTAWPLPLHTHVLKGRSPPLLLEIWFAGITALKAQGGKPSAHCFSCFDDLKYDHGKGPRNQGENVGWG